MIAMRFEVDDHRIFQRGETLSIDAPLPQSFLARRCCARGTTRRSIAMPRAARCGGASRARAGATRRAACAACRRASTCRTRARRRVDDVADQSRRARGSCRSSPVPTLMCCGSLVVLHQEHARVGEIVDVQELAPRRAACPRPRPRRARSTFASWNLRISAGRTCELVEIEVVVRPVQVGRHRRDEVAAVLRAVGLAQLDARDLRDRVRLVGRLERAGEQCVLGHRLRGTRAGRCTSCRDTAASSRRYWCAACTTVAWIIMLS